MLRCVSAGQLCTCPAGAAVRFGLDILRLPLASACTARHFTLRSRLLLPGEIQAVGKETAQGHYTSGLMSPSIPMFFLCLHLSICEMGVIPGC